MTTAEQVVAAVRIVKREQGPATDGDPDMRRYYTWRVRSITARLLDRAGNDPETEQDVAQLRLIAKYLTLPNLAALVRDLENADVEVGKLVIEAIKAGEMESPHA